MASGWWHGQTGLTALSQALQKQGLDLIIWIGLEALRPMDLKGGTVNLGPL